MVFATSKDDTCKTKEFLKNMIYLYYASRAFPFSNYLLILFPFLSILFASDLMKSIWDVSLIIPFIISMTGGFIYNTICDLTTDPREKNILAQGLLQKKSAEKSVAILVLATIISSIILYKSLVAIILFWFISLMAYLYSGLKIRLKESLFAPIIASITLWVGAPLVLLTEFNYFNNISINLLLGLFFIYMGYEIQHTIRDYENDLAFDIWTFAVRVGKKNAIIVEYLSLAVGYVFLLVSLYNYTGFLFTNKLILFSIIFFISIAQTVAYGYKVQFNIERNSIFPIIPYHINKIFLIFYGSIILKIPEAIILYLLYFHLSNILSLKFLSNFFNDYLDDNQTIKIQHIKGWFDIEKQDDLSCRWIEDNAYLMLTPKKNQIAILKFKARSFHIPRTLEISCNGHFLHSSSVPTHLTDIKITLEINRGANLIGFKVPNGCQRPCDIDELKNSDSRSLGINICGLDISVLTHMENEKEEQFDQVCVFKEGWHEIENFESHLSRWMKGEALIKLISTGGKIYEICFDAKSFFRPRTLIIYDGFLQIRQVYVPTYFISVKVILVTKNGLNVLRLKTEEGGERPCDLPGLNNNDSRELSILIKNFKIEIK
ncbi:MAG: UbiA family prenyltransferase [Methanothrix sp.]|nr:UbiA family prenyltransferase [Methanothrix sp.]